MLLPLHLLVILISVPKLVHSQAQPKESCTSEKSGQCIFWASTNGCQDNPEYMNYICPQSCNQCPCRDDSQCVGNNLCVSGRCVNLCDFAQCGQGSNCHVVGRQSVCYCPTNTEGNPTIECRKRKSSLGIQGCTEHSHCAENEQCDADTNFCVNPCELITCGKGAKCLVLGRHPQCICPPYTQGNPLEQCELEPVQGCRDNSQCRNYEYCDRDRCVPGPCATVRCDTNTRCVVLQAGKVACQPITADRVNNHGSDVNGANQGDNSGGSQVAVNQGENTGIVFNNVVGDGNHGGGAQVSNQIDENQAGKLPGGNHVNNQGGGAQVGNQGGVGQGSNQGGGAQVGNQGSNSHGSNQGSGAQVGNQGGNSHGSNQGGGAQVVNQGGGTQDRNEGGGAQAGNQVGVGQGSNQGGGAQVGNQATGCNDFSHCGVNEVCKSGKCVDPCESVICGKGVKCQVVQKQPKCLCPDSTLVDPNQQCLSAHKQVCRINSQCGSNERCESGSCVDPCVSVKCGDGSICQVSQRQGQCVCPAGTEGNPREQCNPIPDLDVGFPDDNLTQTPPTNVSGKGTRLPGCLDVPDPGECRGAFKRFYYNNQTDQCDCFLFGGCDEDRIKFTWDTLEECQQICLPGNKAQGPGCKRVTVEEVQSFLEEERRNRENNSN